METTHRKQLVIFPIGSLSPKDKERMSKEGFLAIECSDPSRVIVALPSTSLIQSDDLTLSALNALTGVSSGDELKKFAHNLISKINANAAKKP